MASVFVDDTHGWILSLSGSRRDIKASISEAAHTGLVLSHP